MNIALVFDEEAKLVADPKQLSATFEEALFAAENDLLTTWSVELKLLDETFAHIDRFQTMEDSAINRIARVELLRKTRQLAAASELLMRTLPYVLADPVRCYFQRGYEVMLCVQGIAGRLLGQSSATNWGVDVYRSQTPSLATVIFLDETEVKDMTASRYIHNFYDLRGGGWDLFDLPRRPLVEKAIPAILCEVARIENPGDEPLNISDLLNLSSWSIGLH